MTKKSFGLAKVVAALAVAVFFYACGSAPTEVKKPISANVNPQIGAGHTEKAAAAATSQPAAAAASAAPASAKDKAALIAAGKTLVSGGDCLACHQEQQKLVGPAYVEVAKKYKESDVAHLAKKVIDGGSGAWGPIPMAPHANLSQKDAEAMIYYILSIK